MFSTYSPRLICVELWKNLAIHKKNITLEFAISGKWVFASGGLFDSSSWLSILFNKEI